MGDISGSGSANGMSFDTNYRSSCYGSPTVYAANAYDCTRILINALQIAVNSNIPPTGLHDMSQAKIFRQAVITDIQQDTSYNGVTGHYSFSNGSGDPDNGGTAALYQFDTINQLWNYLPQAETS